jgi:hypothetical protein
MTTTEELIYSLGQKRSHVRSTQLPNETICGRWIGSHWLNGGEHLPLCDHCAGQLERRLEAQDIGDRP